MSLILTVPYAHLPPSKITTKDGTTKDGTTNDGTA